MEGAKKTKRKPADTAAPKEKRAEVSAKASLSSEFAVIMTGGKQYVVSPGRTIKIEKIAGAHKAGDTLTFDKVLLVDSGSDTTVGTPFISGAKVTGHLEKFGRGRTIEVIKYKQKSRYFKRIGHRQPYFLVKIEAIK